MSSLRVCVVTFPFRPGVDSAWPLSELVRVLEKITDSIHLITANLPQDTPWPEMQLCDVGWSSKQQPTLLNVFKSIVTQFKFSYRLLQKTREFDIALFFGASTFLLPMLTARAAGRRLILVISASETKIAERIYEEKSWVAGKTAEGMVPVLESLGRRLCHRMIVYSPNLIKELHLEKYSHKISIAHEHFLDFSEFRVTKPLNERENLIGYVARLSREKGTLNFLEAIPEVLETREGTTLLIGGDGPLRPQVEEYVNKSDDKVKYVGWIPHDELPEYLNRLRLLVVPSYTEGLPNNMLEAMACGTPILATPVGAIPDIIKDGRTGFIMENNSPECIAKNIIRAISHPGLEQIARNARALVEREFTRETAVERYKKILDSLKQKI